MKHSDSTQIGESGKGAAPSARSGTGRLFLTRGRSKDIAIQAVVLLLLLAAIGYLVRNILGNLDALGVETGFAFLNKPAGFSISQALITYTSASTYLDAFLVALLNTASLTLVCIVLATLLGLVVALARVSSNPMISTAATVFIETIRNIPLLLQLLIWYFVVVRSLPPPRDSLSFFDLVFVSNRGMYFPVLSGVSAGFLIGGVAIGTAVAILLRRMSQSGDHALASRTKLYILALAALVLVPIAPLWLSRDPLEWSVPQLTGLNFSGGGKVVPEFVAMALGITVYSTAFIAEIFRGGLNAVPGGLREAGFALGLLPGFVNRKIVVPLALRAALPPLGGQYVIMLKNTSLAAAIAYPDLMQVMAGTALNQTGQPIEVMLITLGAYVFLGLVISLAVNLYNRRLALVTR